MEIIPAILEKNIKKLEEKLKKLEPYFNKVQVDIGDGEFVSDEFGCINQIKKLETKMSLEVHLMTNKPWENLEQIKGRNLYKTLGQVVFHYESFLSIPKKTRSFAINNLIKRIRGIGKNVKVGIAINPETNPGSISEYLGRIDEVLLLAVTPGKQGQKFQDNILFKVNYLKNIKKDLIIGVDGGVNDENIKKIISLGIEKIYVGSFLWKQDSLEDAIKKLSE
jgi:ribulose-phosphate 3-epimerase